MTDYISFQGEPGANSHIAARAAFPELEPLPCASFDDAFAAVSEGQARYAMIPIENSVAGRVADVHTLIPESGLYIIGERFVPIRHQLLGLKDATLEGLTHVRSHPQALGQCRKQLRELGVAAVKTADTAGAAREIAELGDPSIGALASGLAGEIYGLKVLKADIADAPHNTTRFLVFAREAQNAALGSGPCMTSFVFRVRNVPAALYKALGGFATNGVNMTKLESYIEGGAFSAAMFFLEVEGHPEEQALRLALEELAFFSTSLKVLGVYPADPFRRT
ncbi:prephenate dehydratase [Terricaulis sp.]|uniref:prephenate dehydratase n=1 Tax=Terricaulis sp. TaxID=2768686 RepID=UPI002AC6C372|nr:prephenate dehydratase [Terricaulis sp.]MDZ4692056.1 prephenate dehydratase [Terricaulis sp.]